MKHFRSLNDIYAQIIDDEKGITLVSSSSIDHDLRSTVQKLSKTEQAVAVGKQIAERAKEKKIKEVVFDRGGFIFHGRVKALADGARAGGLKF